MSLSSEDFDGSRVDLRDCWRELGRAVAVFYGCYRATEEIEIYTGSLAIYIDSLYFRDREILPGVVARELKPLNESAPWPLPAPQALSCREYTQVAIKYRRFMPSVLRPRQGCSG